MAWEDVRHVKNKINKPLCDSWWHESRGVLWNGQNESDRDEYKYIHKCQSLGKVEKMTTIGEIGRIDAADAVIQCWKTSSITPLWRHFSYNGPRDQKLMSFWAMSSDCPGVHVFQDFFQYKPGCFLVHSRGKCIGKKESFSGTYHFKYAWTLIQFSQNEGILCCGPFAINISQTGMVLLPGWNGETEGLIDLIWSWFISKSMNCLVVAPPRVRHAVHELFESVLGLFIFMYKKMSFIWPLNIQVLSSECVLFWGLISLYYPCSGVCRRASLHAVLCYKAADGKGSHRRHHRRGQILPQWGQTHPTADRLQNAGQWLRMQQKHKLHRAIIVCIVCYQI